MPPVSQQAMQPPPSAAQGAARRLRRLTMAYLQPTRAKPQVIQSALNQADNVYSMGVRFRCGRLQLLCIMATILERNRELSFPGRLNLDQLIRDAFLIYAADTSIANKDDLTPFYQLEDVSFRCSTATLLVKAVINALLKGDEVRRKMSMYVGDESTTEQQAQEQCSIS